MSVMIYGIKQCSTMKKAFEWLNAHEVEYRFHDYKKSGIDTDTLARWCAQAGWEALINKRGTTWRKLDASQQAISSEPEAIELMKSHTSLIRRPVVIASGGDLLIGFDEHAFSEKLAKPGDDQ